MWVKLAQFILRNRIFILSLIFAITLVLGYFALTNIKLDNKYGTMLPKNSPNKQDYELLKKSFGGSESLLIFAIDSKDLYTKDKFQAWYDLGVKISEFDAVDSVLSEAKLYEVKKDAVNEKFYFDAIVKTRPTTQVEVDSLRKKIESNPVYDGILYNEDHSTSLMMIFINEVIMQDMKKAQVLFEIEAEAKKFEGKLGQIRMSGMPHIRVSVGEKLKGELGLFIFLSIGVTSLLLYFFFRSFKIVLIANTVVFIGVIWSLGSIGALNYDLSVLMVLIPPLIIVISIPNCIFLINKFHQEIKNHGNKARALTRVIQKIGNATFLTNFTTAIGFSTFIFTNSERLSEFGIIASINILAVFLVSISILPIVLSYSKIPKPKHLDHLEKQWLKYTVGKIETISTNKRKWVLGACLAITVISILGIVQIKATGNITGDLPKHDQITQDVEYLQNEFGGSVPFDVLLDTKKKNSFYSRFEEIETAQAYLKTFNSFSKSLSIADAIKLANMAFSNGDPTKFELPSDAKLRMIGKYVENSVGDADGTNGFLDSTRTITRITAQMRDLGSYEIKSLLDSMRPEFVNIINPDKKFNDSLLAIISTQEGAAKDGNLTLLYQHSPGVLNDLTSIYAAGNSELEEKFLNDDALIYTYHDQPGFNDSLSSAISLNEWNVIFTGTAIVASYGTLYLVNNLSTSLLIAICVIGLLMALLFRSWRMVVVSLVPNFLPLIVTAGVMGYTGIPIKPSTLLVFSIAFGISVDDTIHFLAKFRQELKLHEHDLKRCILVALRETGGSMIYTSIVLFFGFLTFSFSQFGGTKALGVLISLTLLVAMLANLVILPSLLLYMEKKISNKALAEPLFQLYDEEEDIEFDDLSIANGDKPDDEDSTQAGLKDGE